MLITKIPQAPISVPPVLNALREAERLWAYLKAMTSHGAVIRSMTLMACSMTLPFTGYPFLRHGLPLPVTDPMETIRDE